MAMDGVGMPSLMQQLSGLQRRNTMPKPNNASVRHAQNLLRQQAAMPGLPHGLAMGGPQRALQAMLLQARQLQSMADVQYLQYLQAQQAALEANLMAGSVGGLPLPPVARPSLADQLQQSPAMLAGLMEGGGGAGPAVNTAMGMGPSAMHDRMGAARRHGKVAPYMAHLQAQVRVPACPGHPTPSPTPSLQLHALLALDCWLGRWQTQTRCCFPMATRPAQGPGR